MADERLLTVRQVAERLQVNAETVRRWLRSGGMHGISLGSDRGGWRIAESEVERFLSAANDVKAVRE